MNEINDRAVIEAARRVEMARPSAQRRVVLERELHLLRAASATSPIRSALGRFGNRIVALSERVRAQGSAATQPRM